MRRVAVIHAFLDESGTHPETPVLSVAGFYGCQGQWEIFNNLWKPIIHGREFHAWESNEIFPELCSAIRHSAIDGFLCTIGKETYRQNTNEHMKSFMGNEYAICAFSCALSICREVKGEPVSFVIEHGQPNISFVKRVLESMMDRSEFRIASVATAKKADFIALHPADFISHLGSSHDKPWMAHLMDAGRLKHAHVTEEMIKLLAPQVSALVRESRRQRKELKSRMAIVTDSHETPHSEG